MKNKIKNIAVGQQLEALELMDAIFGIVMPEDECQPLFSGFPDSPKKVGGWPVRTMDNGQFPSLIKKTNNNYFTLAKYRPTPEGDYRAQRKYISSVHAMLIDDIGTKITSEMPLPLSCKIRTSPGNYQGILILDKPCTNVERYEAIVKALGEKDWSDTGASGAYRLARLPFGVNNKNEHLVDGVASKVKLVFSKPNRRYSLEQISDAFKLDLTYQGHTGKNDPAKTSNACDDSVLSALKAAGLWKSELEPGKHDITCPFVNLHTGQEDHGTAYYGPNADNQQQGGFKCLHGHCSTRNISNLKDFLGIASVEQKKKSQVESALELVADLPVFHDEKEDTFCHLEGRCLPLKSRDVRTFISRKVYLGTGKTLSSNSLGEVLTMLEGKARFESEQIDLHVRIASYKGSFWYDLGDGRAIKTGRKGWKIVKAPMLFRKYDHQQEQVAPVPGGNALKILEYLNIPKKHHLETMVLIISYLIPDIAHPIIHTHGPKGSAKSTSCRLIKRLIDPSALELISSTKDKKSVIQLLSKHHMPVFDNVSRIDSELSDIFCTACTGGGVSERTLYTNDEECIYNFKRCIAINGINLLITKPDLLDRTMLLHFELIKAENRREEKELLSDFEAAKPEILGGMFDILAKAMRIYPKVSLVNLPRLADFAKWGYAIAEAIKKGKGEQFMLDYQDNVRRQNAEVLQNNSLCLAVTQLMDKQAGRWTGTVKEALEALRVIAEPDKADKTFPSDTKSLRKHLELIQSTLVESEGIDFKFADKRQNDGYHVTFTKKVAGEK